MKTKNELFMDAIEWLIDNGLAENQGDIAVKAGLGPNLISRIKNGHVKSVSNDAIRALCNRFKELNIDYLRGKSDDISSRRSALDDSLMVENAFEKKMGKYISNLETHISDLQKQIELLEKDREDKKEEIKNLNERIAVQKQAIDDIRSERENLKIENAKLRVQLEAFQNGNAINYLFPIGVADKEDINPARV
jgi:transcriptional regulator with XRE-family HTH domain